MGKKNVLTKSKKAEAERLALSNHLAEAQVLYASVCKIDPMDVEAWVKRAVIQCRLGFYEEAESFARRALLLEPSLAFAQLTLATVLKYQGKAEEASVVLERGLEQRPNSAEHLLNLASLRDRQGRVDEAHALYRRALELQPDTNYVLAKQADLLEKEGRLEEAEEVVARGMARERMHPELNLAAARLDRRKGDIAKAVGRLEAVIHYPMSPDTKAEISIFLGQLHDLLGNRDKVLPYLLEGKRRHALDMDPRGTVRSRFLSWVDTDRAWVSERLLSVPRSGLPAPDESPVFVIGFLRSGTTLLEQVLDSHPGLQALNEKPMGEMMEDAFCETTKGRPDPVASLSDEQVAMLREVYWREAARHCERRQNTLLVDKQPFNIIRLPLLWRVFPHARFIFTMRHPCDVVLGCLMQRFGSDNLMTAFPTLETIAELYSHVMNAWLEYAERMPMSWQGIRYEDLISNLEPEVRKLLEFLCVDWNDAVLGHTQHAQRRGIINTPSYHQVTQPLYQHAKYRWKHYEAAFASILPHLMPFIEAFGYSQESHSTEIAMSNGI